MLEALFLVLIVIVLFVSFFAYSRYVEKKSVEDAQRAIVSATTKLKITERKFMQNKIKKNVFDALVDDLESELISAELVLFRAQKSEGLMVDPKLEEVVTKLDKPTKYRKAKVEHILKETELLRSEISLLESKLLKREIKQSVFERLIKDKESALIKKEKELMDIVAQASNDD